ncbi:uncharacterized protein LOC119613979 [Lucilia sericata]|uniref:uncharacterized protein LOC119613979 n=1 Tax=Lucilia sericata TaxID=13632 RepID=UPI0018A86A37|nr:uncharacterized protein LOC119613979 [Lucilia sericata]
MDNMNTVVDNTLLDLLIEWDLEHLHNHFTEHRITTKVLKILKPDHIRTLFQGLAVGDQALFESNLESWRKDACGTLTTSPQNVIAKQAICSVLTMLQNTKNGRSILQYYEENKILHEEQRQLLIKTIAAYIESKDMTYSIPIEYYNNGKRGKLYSKIYNLKRLSKTSSSPKEPAQEECHQEYFSESDANMLLKISVVKVYQLTISISLEKVLRNIDLKQMIEI